MASHGREGQLAESQLRVIHPKHVHLGQSRSAALLAVLEHARRQRVNLCKNDLYTHDQHDQLAKSTFTCPECPSYTSDVIRGRELRSIGTSRFGKAANSRALNAASQTAEAEAVP